MTPALLSRTVTHRSVRSFTDTPTRTLHDASGLVAAGEGTRALLCQHLRVHHLYQGVSLGIQHSIQGQLAYKKPHPPRTLPWAYT